MPVRNFLADGRFEVVLRHSDDRVVVVEAVVVMLDVDELKVPPLWSVLLWNGNPETYYNMEKQVRVDQRAPAY